MGREKGIGHDDGSHRHGIRCSATSEKMMSLIEIRIDLSCSFSAKMHSWVRETIRRNPPQTCWRSSAIFIQHSPFDGSECRQQLNGRSRRPSHLFKQKRIYPLHSPSYDFWPRNERYNCCSFVRLSRVPPLPFHRNGIQEFLK